MEILQNFSKSMSADLRALAKIFFKRISTALYPKLPKGYYYRTPEEPLVLSFRLQ